MHPLNLPRQGLPIATRRGMRVISSQKYRIIRQVDTDCITNVYLITTMTDQTLEEYQTNSRGITTIGAAPVDCIDSLPPGRLYENSNSFQAIIEDLYPV